MNEVEALDVEYKKAQVTADEKADLRAMAIAREVDAGPRGTQAAIARRLGVKEPTIHGAVQRGRALIAELAKKAAEKGSAAVV